MARNCVTIVKEHETYVFVYDQESVSLLVETLERLASDPSSTLSPFDAAAARRRVWRLESGQ
jgi:hypothetical protein